MSETLNSVKSICVFCGSSYGKSPLYRTAAEQLAQLFVAQGIQLVYGGGGVGLMGVIARTVAEAGGQVIGVLPTALRSKELPFAEEAQAVYGELILVETMHERKATMARLADAYIALPGGYGTLEELFETITWGQLGIQRKAIGLLNVNGYFDPILAWVDHAINEGFVQAAYRDLIVTAAEPETLLTRLVTHTPPAGILRLETWRA
ncbi:MAG: TIGR00730 family Rossman fold protein [Caldilineaceae bacterium]|nr:TIGR00730 family Rossman fold protein [Caldilineaceae bacterium]